MREVNPSPPVTPPEVTPPDDPPNAAGQMVRGMAQLTPVMRQWQTAKDAYPHCIVFFRLGDFYEVFFEDARLCALELDVTLTARGNAPDGGKIPMAGVPAVQGYVYAQRLVDKGHRVAFCDQLEAPEQSSGKQPVRRGVTHVLTPGLALEPEAASADEHLVIAALDVDAQGWRLAACELSAGRLSAASGTKIDDLASALVREEVRELVLQPAALAEVRSSIGALQRPPHLSVLEHDNVRAAVARLGRSALDAWPESERAAVLALGRFGAGLEGQGALETLLGYIALHRPQAAPVGRLQPGASAAYLELDAQTVRHLELTHTQQGHVKGSLLHTIDRTSNVLGRRTLRQWLLAPLKEAKAIEARQAAVAFMLGEAERLRALHPMLKGFPDLERLATRAELGLAKPREVGAIRETLRRLQALGALLEQWRASPAARDNPYLAVGLPPAALLTRLETELVAEPPLMLGQEDAVAPGVSAALDRFRELARGGRALLVALETREREQTGIHKLKVRYNRVFGYFIEISTAQAGRVPEHYQRKQTLANAERFTTPELLTLEKELAQAESARGAEEAACFEALRAAVGAEAVGLRHLARAVGALDACVSFARLAQEGGYVRPRLLPEARIEVAGLRHPVVEAMLAAGAFVPNDLHLGAGPRLALITGPNMGGKSTYMRQVAVAVILAQCGSYLPAEQAALGLFDRVFTRVGASDDLGAGQSTFMVEMLETARILRESTTKSLVLFDEVGRGTSTQDGLALARAIAEDLLERRPLTLFATHFHELCDLATEGEDGRCINLRVAVTEHDGRIVFLHRLERGAASHSFGIEVARLAGLPSQVLRRAEALLNAANSAASLRASGAPLGDAPDGAGAPSHVAQSDMARRGSTPPGVGSPEVRQAASASAPQLALLDAVASHRAPGAGSPASGPPPQVTKPLPPSKLVARLEALDVHRITPLEALNELARLKSLL